MFRGRVRRQLVAHDLDVQPGFRVMSKQAHGRPSLIEIFPTPVGRTLLSGRTRVSGPLIDLKLDPLLRLDAAL